MSKSFKILLRRVCISAAQRQNVKSTHGIHDIDKIRNIGILAHIDAGKTTTTERMLFYSGRIRNMGEVHHGNTVTDYMAQERDRGITITSAAVMFAWDKHRINLIDTPGHIDFTMEVEQSLNVMDGAIVILDASAGVEAQTLTVWHQADRYNIPRLVYCNKMDRSDGSLPLCLQSLKDKLSVCPLAIQLPIRDNGRLTGVVDLLNLEKCLWSGDRGEKLTREPLTEGDMLLWHEAKHAREKLTDMLSDIDNDLAETVIKLESLDNVSHQHLSEALRRICLAQKGVPVLCGSSYKNIGVQLLMDAVTDFLPSPNQCRQHKVFSAFQGNLAARAFKVIHDKQRGPIVFFRIYSGKLSKGSKLYNLQQNKWEQVGKVMIVEADDFEEVHEITEGNIAAVTGLKVTVTGDIVSNSVTAFNTAKKALSEEHRTSGSSFEDFGLSAQIPDPVFFCSIEPPSQAYQSELDTALEQLQREDPSLRVNQNEETGQTILAGMGELHIDVIKERIRSEYKIDVELGPLQISYKETLTSAVSESHSVSHHIGSGKHNMKVTLTILPEKKKELLQLDKSKDNAANTAAITVQQMKAIRRGVLAGLAHGPILGAPVVDVNIMLHWLEVGRGTSDTIISAGVSQCIKKMLSEGSAVLLEPIMMLEVVTDENYLSSVLADLSRRRTTIKNIDSRGTHKVVTADTPLSEMLGYARDLRTLSSGTASFSMEFSFYQQMAPIDQVKAVKTVTGF